MFHVIELYMKSASNVKFGSVTDEQMVSAQVTRGTWLICIKLLKMKTIKLFLYNLFSNGDITSEIKFSIWFFLNFHVVKASVLYNCSRKTILDIIWIVATHFLYTKEWRKKTFRKEILKANYCLNIKDIPFHYLN